MSNEVAVATKEELVISISKQEELFKKHIGITDNNQILFSAPFGTGKTTFLKKIFEKQEKYQVFHLFPINYQVAENKDVFELLKYDILSELIQLIDFEQDEESLQNKFREMQYLFMTEGTGLLLEILKTTPKLGKYVGAFDKIIKFCSKVKESVSQNDNDDFSKLIDYYKKIESQSGSIYELDAITNFIYGEIKNLNEEKVIVNGKKEKKETVLILDDLDRIDPRHIFRLLNVFSSHFDQRKFEGNQFQNKFGFSKIILVCDSLNIETIFKKQYGENADFKGYFDKFRAKDTFHFDNSFNWLSNLNEISRAFVRNNEGYYERGNIFYNFAAPIIHDLLNNKLINCRQLLKLKDYPISIDGYSKMKFKQHSEIAEKNVSWTYLVLLMLHEGNKQNLKSSILYLSKLEISKFNHSYKQIDLEILIEILMFKVLGSKFNGSRSDTVGNIKMSYDLKDGKVTLDENLAKGYMQSTNIYEICKEAFSVLDALV